jgi:hypothetical protein
MCQSKSRSVPVPALTGSVNPHPRERPFVSSARLSTASRRAHPRPTSGTAITHPGPLVSLARRTGHKRPASRDSHKRFFPPSAVPENAPKTPRGRVAISQHGTASKRRIRVRLLGTRRLYWRRARCIGSHPRPSVPHPMGCLHALAHLVARGCSGRVGSGLIAEGGESTVPVLASTKPGSVESHCGFCEG